MRSPGGSVPPGTDALGGLAGGVAPGRPARTRRGSVPVIGRNFDPIRSEQGAGHRGRTRDSAIQSLGTSSPLSPGSVRLCGDGVRVIGPEASPHAVVRPGRQERVCGRKPPEQSKKLPLSATWCHLATQSQRPGAVRRPAPNRRRWRAFGCRETRAEPAGRAVTRPAPGTTPRNPEAMHRPILTRPRDETNWVARPGAITPRSARTAPKSATWRT
jgi:hypothetical protein